MILYYCILGVAFCMSVATWALYRHSRWLQLEFERSFGWLERQVDYWVDEAAWFSACNTHNLGKVIRYKRALRQHQAAAGYRKSGESVDLQALPFPLLITSGSVSREERAGMIGRKRERILCKVQDLHAELDRLRDLCPHVRREFKSALGTHVCLDCNHLFPLADPDDEPTPVARASEAKGYSIWG